MLESSLLKVQWMYISGNCLLSHPSIRRVCHRCVVLLYRKTKMSDSEVNSETSSLLPDKNNEFKAKTYKTRWLVLAVFFLHLVDTNITWSNVDSIADLAKCYYNVDVLWINSLSYLYFVTYTLFFILATWFLENYGLRWAAIVSGCFNAVGAWLRFSGAGKYNYSTYIIIYNYNYNIIIIIYIYYVLYVW